jgi:hypothetical protein
MKENSQRFQPWVYRPKEFQAPEGRQKTNAQTTLSSLPGLGLFFLHYPQLKLWATFGRHSVASNS